MDSFDYPGNPHMRLCSLRSCIALLVAASSGFATAQAIPGLSAANITPGTNYPAPVAIRAPNDGSGRIFIVQQGGLIRIVKNGAVLPTPFVTVPTRFSGESGLLGMAFHPNFGKAGLPHNDEFYVAHTRPSSTTPLGSWSDQAITRYTVPTLDSDVANPTGTLVIRVPDNASNHNGGDIHFGPDGYLYYSMGDGGSQGNPHGFAQCLWKKAADNNPASCGTSAATYFLMGKILRLDVDNRGGAVTSEMCGSSGISPAEYSIPASNPHVGTTNTCDEIWLHGFRNPWRFSIQPGTGNLVIGDVGQDRVEEITVQTAGVGGSNHGWSQCEGRRAYPSGTATTCPATTGTVAPVIDYLHQTFGCAVSGGYVYRGPSARLRGTYFFGDSCESSIMYATAGLPQTEWSPTGLQNTGINPGGTVYGFGEDEAGNLYVGMSNSTVHKIQSDFIFDNGFD